MAGKTEYLLSDSLQNPGGAAMLLALTQTLHDEEHAKRAVTIPGRRFVVTEVGGKSCVDDFQEKVNRAVIGASLNAKLIEKLPNEVHAIIHALEEAKKGIMPNISSGAHLALKIAIVRDSRWIAVAMFGKSALHYITNHERAGLGIMHI